MSDDIEKLSEKLRRLETQYSVSYHSISRENLDIRYSLAIGVAAEAAAVIDMLELRNAELTEENARLKDLLFRAMEKHLIVDDL